MKHIKLKIGFAVFAAVSVGWIGYCIAESRPFTPRPGGAMVRTVTGIALGVIRNGRYTPEGLERWVNSPNEVRFGQPPANARRVPLLVPQNRAPIARTVSMTGRAGRTEFFRQLRRALVAAGRGDEDVRVTGLRIAIESGWLRVAWQNNLGNIKSQGRVYAPTREDALRGVNLFTTIPNASSLYVLKDRLNSVDGYAGFDQLSQYLAYDLDLLRRRYPGALRGAIRGGYDGLVECETALGRGGYSSAPTVARLAHAWGYWNANKRIFGPVFENRVEFERLIQ